jgi:hypothetical protein
MTVLGCGKRLSLILLATHSNVCLFVHHSSCVLTSARLADTMSGRIDVRVEYTDTGSLFTVEDTGVGIEAEGKSHRQTVNHCLSMGQTLTRCLVVSTASRYMPLL